MSVATTVRPMYHSFHRSAGWLAIAALSLGSFAAAQATHQVVTCDGPTRTVHVKVVEGAPQFSGVATQPQVSFANVNGTTFFLLLLSGVDEYIDYGVKTAGLDGQVTQIRLEYITDAVDPSLGGPGASLELNLYAGSNGNCIADPSAPGTPIETISLSGLPGAFGNPFQEVIELVLDFSANPIAIPDGPIGWGVRSTDTSYLPRLVAVGENPTGTKDFLDNFNAGNCLGPVAFELNDRPFSSLFIELTEGAIDPQPCGFTSYGPFNAPLTSTLMTFGGDGVGDSVTFVGSFNLLQGTAFLILSEQPAATPLPGAEVLIDLDSQLLLLTYPFSLLGQVIVDVPDNPALAGMTVFCQSAAFDPLQPSGLQLTNGLRFDVCP